MHDTKAVNKPQVEAEVANNSFFLSFDSNPKKPPSTNLQKPVTVKQDNGAKSNKIKSDNNTKEEKTVNKKD